MDALGADAFASSLLASDMKVVKAQYSQQGLLKEALNFSSTADPIIEQLGTLVKRMLGMHREASRADRLGQTLKWKGPFRKESRNAREQCPDNDV